MDVKEIASFAVATHTEETVVAKNSKSVTRKKDVLKRLLNVAKEKSLNVAKKKNVKNKNKGEKVL